MKVVENATMGITELANEDQEFVLKMKMKLQLKKPLLPKYQDALVLTEKPQLDITAKTMVMKVVCGVILAIIKKEDLEKGNVSKIFLGLKTGLKVETNVPVKMV